jgi:hypothetical protein
MRLQKFAIFVVGGILGLAGGFALGIFVYPYIFLADIVATETVDPARKKIVATGTFIHANPADPIHYGAGKVTVYADSVFLHDDFKVGPGPKFHVYLVPEAEVTPKTDVAKTMYVDLGRLRAFQGSQNYPVPPGVVLTQYQSVVIWCEHFGVLISPAKLTFVTR